MSIRLKAVAGLLLALGGFALEAVAQPGPAGKVPPQLPPQAAEQAQQKVLEHTAPTVNLIAPAAGALYTMPANVLLEASVSASSSGKSIMQVEFFAGATLLGSITAAPYSFNWNQVASGTYSLTARATDNLGVASTSSPVTIMVNAPPSVSLTSPVSGMVFTAPATIDLAATAADADGTVTQVEFFQGATLIATDTSAPYSFTLSNVAAGSYSFMARATDNQGATTASAVVNVTVNAPPTVTLTSPTNNATFTAPADITITAQVADTDGTISQVDFYEGANLIATRTTPPYSILWTGVPAGSYSLTARATDNLGATTTSETVSVTVTAAVGQIFYIHADHLNTPRRIYNQGQQLVWSWDHAEPFGSNPPNENPLGLGNFTCNLRLPGQYFDKETGLHYNYFRDLDPGIGRYIESDPIELRGGINTYVYAYDPLTQIDPRGLAGAPMSGAALAMSAAVYRLRQTSICGTGMFTGPEFSFREACRAHDRCYDTCGANRYVCDDEFSRQAHGSCPPSDVMCHTLAVTYYTLMKFGGMVWSFDVAQRDACKAPICR